MTENHDYRTPSEGTLNWGDPLNANFRDLDTDVEIRGPEADLEATTPKAGAKFFTTETGSVYLGDGNEWTKVPEPHGIVARDFAELETILSNIPDKTPRVIELLSQREVGEYNVANASSLPVRIPDGVHIRGQNPTRWGAGSPKPDDEAVTVISLQDVPGGDFDEEAILMGSNTTIESVTFRGSSTRTAIEMNGDQGSNDCTLYNTTFWKILGHAVLCQGAFGNEMRKCHVKDCGDDGTATNNGDARAALKVTGGPQSEAIGQLAVLGCKVVCVPDNPYRCHTITSGGARSDIVGSNYKINEGNAGIFSSGQLRFENGFITSDNSPMDNALLHVGGGNQRKLKDIRVEKSKIGIEISAGQLPEIVNEVTIINCNVGLQTESVADDAVWNDVRIRGCDTGIRMVGLEGWTINGLELVDNANWHIDTRDAPIASEPSRRPFLIDGAVFAGAGTPFPEKRAVDIRDVDLESTFQRRARSTAVFSGDGSQDTFTVSHGLSYPTQNVLADDLIIDTVPSSQDAIDASPIVASAVDTGGVTGDHDSIRMRFASPPASGTDNVAVRWSAELMMGADHD